MLLDRRNCRIEIPLDSAKVTVRELSRCLIDPTLKTPEVLPPKALGVISHMKDHPASIVRIRLASQVPD